MSRKSEQKKVVGVGIIVEFALCIKCCDVDDLITNTLGGLIGFGLVLLLEKYMTVIPVIERFDIGRAEKKMFVRT